MLRRVLSLFLAFSLLFTQAGFAQIAAELNIASHLSSLHNSLVSESFRSLHLRYLSFSPLNNNFKLLLDKGSLKDPSSQEIEDTSKILMQYFLTGLTLPNDTFWVNLRPDSPDQIIDDRLAQTDIGKVMLETDLQLKKDTASFTSPQTPEGKEYWDKLYKKAEELYGYENITIPTLTRPWIVPGEIIIRETADSAYIYKATLKVMLEQDYLKNTPKAITSSTDYTFKDQRSKALNEYSTQLIRELIIPKLTKEVNSSKRYASLRQVYYSLIMAQWFKARFKGKQGDYYDRIDRQDLTNLTSKEDWSKTTYFNAYKKSFTEGEYNIKEAHYTPTGQVIRSYFSGGISGIAPVIPSFGDVTFTDPKTSTRISSSPASSDLYGILNKSKNFLIPILVLGAITITAIYPSELKIMVQEKVSMETLKEASLYKKSKTQLIEEIKTLSLVNIRKDENLISDLIIQLLHMDAEEGAKAYINVSYRYFKQNHIPIHIDSSDLGKRIYQELEQNSFLQQQLINKIDTSRDDYLYDFLRNMPQLPQSLLNAVALILKDAEPKLRDRLLNVILLNKTEGLSSEADKLINNALAQIGREVLEVLKNKLQFLTESDLLALENKIKNMKYVYGLTSHTDADFNVGIGHDVETIRGILAHEIGHNILFLNNYPSYIQKIFREFYEYEIVHEYFAELVAGAYRGYYETISGSEAHNLATHQLNAIENALEDNHLQIDRVKLARVAFDNIIQGKSLKDVVSAMLKECGYQGEIRSQRINGAKEVIYVPVAKPGAAGTEAMLGASSGIKIAPPAAGSAITAGNANPETENDLFRQDSLRNYLTKNRGKVVRIDLLYRDVFEERNDYTDTDYICQDFYGSKQLVLNIKSKEIYISDRETHRKIKPDLLDSFGNDAISKFKNKIAKALRERRIYEPFRVKILSDPRIEGLLGILPEEASDLLKDTGEKYFSPTGLIVKNLELGNVLELRLDQLKRLSLETALVSIIDRSMDFCCDVISEKYKLQGLNLPFAMQELIKNAVVYGNRMDFKLPVFIYFDKEKRQLEAYDLAIERKLPDNIPKSWAGRHEGIPYLTDKYKWEYDRSKIIDEKSGQIITRVTIRPRNNANSSPVLSGDLSSVNSPVTKGNGSILPEETASLAAESPAQTKPPAAGSEITPENTSSVAKMDLFRQNSLRDYLIKNRGNVVRIDLLPDDLLENTQYYRPYIYQMVGSRSFVFYIDTGQILIRDPGKDWIIDTGLSDKFIKRIAEAVRKRQICESFRVKLLRNPETTKLLGFSPQEASILLQESMEEPFSQTELIIKNLEIGNVLELRLESLTLEETIQRIIDMRFCFSEISNKYDFYELEHTMQDLLVNAFIHGNRMDLKLPIFIHFDKGTRQIEVYDFAIERKLPENIPAHWTGAKVGISNLARYWEYDRSKIIDEKSGQIITRVTIRQEGNANSPVTKDNRSGSILPDAPPAAESAVGKRTSSSLQKIESPQKNMDLGEAIGFLQSYNENKVFGKEMFRNDILYAHIFLEDTLKFNYEKVVIVGSGIFYLPYLLALMGKEVVVVDRKPHMAGTLMNELKHIQEELDKYGENINIASRMKIINSEIGDLDLESNGLTPESFDLITFFDLSGGKAEGRFDNGRGKVIEDSMKNIKIWLDKALVLLKKDGYIVSDDNGRVGIPMNSLFSEVPARFTPLKKNIYANYNEEPTNTLYAVNKSSSSVEKIEGSQIGGIDFRSLPIVTQAVSNLSAGMSSSILPQLSRVDLDEEWLQIERTAGSGIKLSSERLKEYAQASSALGKISQDRDKIILCISDILRQEEEQNCETEPILRDILVVLESVQQPQELKEVFLGKV